MLADREGPVRVMTWAAVAAFVLAWPLFQIIIGAPTVLGLVLVNGVLGVITSFYFAVISLVGLILARRRFAAR